MNPLFRPPALVAAAMLLTPSTVRAQFASSVIEYLPGAGGSPGYDNPASTLGEPSRVTPGDFGGPVDPFAPAYLPSQLLSLGAGGSLTVRFDAPVRNDPLNPFGLDFLIFGNSGFMVTNEFDSEFNYIGVPATDGSLFGTDGLAEVSVSVDGLEFFTLNPDLTPALDALFPTDGSGDFSQPVDPSLSYAQFAGLTLEGIRGLYAGSGGGAGFNLDWARDTSGAPVTLDEIRFVRVAVTSGRVEIDGLSVVVAVPEPSALALGGLGLGALWRGMHRRRRRSGNS